MTGTIISAARRAVPARWRPAWVPAWSRERRWVAPVTFAGSGVLLFALYLRQARLVPTSSDGAANALQAWDMLHGNLLLRGWSLSDVSFYTTELPQYALVEAARGLNSDTVHVAAAMTYTLVVLLAAVLARGRARGAEGAARALVAVGIMLAPQPGDGRLVLLSSPDHVGTQVPLLLVWLVLDRAPPRWWASLAVGMLLAWAQIADPLTLFEGVLPLVIVSAVRMCRRRGPWRGQWFELSLAAGSIIAVAAADLALALIRHAGGFVVQVPRTALVGASEIAIHLWYAAEGVLLLFGADFFGQPTVAATALALLHLAGVVLVAWALARALRTFLDAEMVLQVLTVAFVLLLAAYVTSGVAIELTRTREIVGVLPIGAVLAGRLVAGRLVARLAAARLAAARLAAARLAAGRLAAGRPAASRLAAGRPARRWLVPAGVAVVACYVGGAVYEAAQSPVPGPNQMVASWLQAHRLTNGIAGYWEANSITADSAGQVQVGAVGRAGRKVRALRWEANKSLYDQRRRAANFFIYSPLDARSDPFDSPSPAEARATFGPPAQTYHVAGDIVLVWPTNLLADLPPWPPWPASRLAGTFSVGALLG
jgi:hypothetical protein